MLAQSDIGEVIDVATTAMDLIGSQNWLEIDRNLAKVNNFENKVVALAWLRITYAVREKLNNWQDLLNRFRQYLIDTKQDTNILTGL